MPTFDSPASKVARMIVAEMKVWTFSSGSPRQLGRNLCILIGKKVCKAAVSL